MPPFTVTAGRRAPDAVARLPTCLATDAEGAVVGALLVERHFPETAEIHLLLVDPARHRQGASAPDRSMIMKIRGPHMGRDVS